MPDDQDDPLVPFNIYIPKSHRERIRKAARNQGVAGAVVGRWIHKTKEADDLLTSLGAPTNAARSDGDNTSV